MVSKALILFALISLVFADQDKSQHDEGTNQAVQNQKEANEMKPTTVGWSHEGKTGFGGGGGGSGGKGWSYGWSHGGVYGAGQKCHFGCCDESFGWSKGGGYYGCKCCFNAQEAKAYMENQAKAQTKN